MELQFLVKEMYTLTRDEIMDVAVRILDSAKNLKKKKKKKKKCSFIKRNDANFTLKMYSYLKILYSIL